MIEFRINTQAMDQLGLAMKRYGQIMPTQKANNALRRSVKPMFRRAQSEVPVGRNGKESISLKTARSALRRGSDPNDYRRGGATRRDLRIKAVPPKAGEISRILVGVSQKRGKVGWRTPFITKGTKVRKTKKGANRGRVQANNFLQRAYSATYQGVVTDFQREYRAAFVQWAKSTWPQIKV